MRFTHHKWSTGRQKQRHSAAGWSGRQTPWGSLEGARFPTGVRLAATLGARKNDDDAQQVEEPEFRLLAAVYAALD